VSPLVFRGIRLGGTGAALAWICLAAVAAEPEITILRPRAGSTALGPTLIELHVSLPEGTVAAGVDLIVDGRPVARLEAPPWKTVWDAGTDGSRGRVIEAVLHLADGRTVRTNVKTSRLVIQEYESVELVNLYLVVRDDGGSYVSGLDQSAFRVFEDGVPQTIERFSATQKPLRVGIVLDTSLSMRRDDRMEKAKDAARSFIETLEPEDEGLVVHFSDKVSLRQDLTSERALLTQAVDLAEPHGGTALYDAIWKTARMLEGFDGRRVMVLLSDGVDESATGFEPGSLHTIDEALDQALHSEVMIFPIGLGRNLDENYVRRWDLNGQSNLDTSTSLADLIRRLAESTGGRAVLSPSPGKLRQAFDDIAADLRNQYSMAYLPSKSEHDGKWRSIEVQTPGRKFKVATRKGYYAAKPVDPDKTKRPS
jgi:VWFA-related protein